MELVKQIDKEDPSNEGESLETRVRNSFFKSQLYGRDKMNVHIVHSAFDTVVDVLFMLSGMTPYLYDCSKSFAVVAFHIRSCVDSHSSGLERDSDLHHFLDRDDGSGRRDLPSLGSVLDLRDRREVVSPFVIENRYGYNKQTLRLFFSDMVKSFLVNMITTLPLSAIVIFILRVPFPLLFHPREQDPTRTSSYGAPSSSSRSS